MVDFIITMRDGSTLQGQTDDVEWLDFCEQLISEPWANLQSTENQSVYWIHTSCVSYVWSKPV